MEAFFSALKRKQLKDVASEALTLLGHTTAAAELKGTTRLTVAAIDRAIKLTQPAETEIEPTTHEDLTDAKGIELLIESGDFKLAKKALKKLDKDHPNYKGFKKSIKKGLKNGSN